MHLEQAHEVHHKVAIRKIQTRFSSIWNVTILNWVLVPVRTKSEHGLHSSLMTSLF